MSSIEPDDGGCEVDGGEEIGGGFVAGRGDGSELFEFAQEVLDQVALFVEPPVEFAGLDPVLPRRDDGRFPGGCQRLKNPDVSIKGPVGGDLRQQSVGCDQIVCLSWR